MPETRPTIVDGAPSRWSVRRARLSIVVAVLATPLAIGLHVFRDYGLPWDEPARRTLGLQAWRFALENDPAYLSNADRHDGAAFEMALFGAERGLGLEGDARRVFFLRHLANYLVFWIGSVALFDVVRRRQGAPLGLVAALLLFCSPRIFADAFYDTRDLASLSFLAMAVWTLGRYTERPGHVRAALHGALCAFATDIRLAGALVVALTLIAFPLAEAERGPPGRRVRVATLLTFLGTGCAAGVAFWPLLWHDPARRLIESVRRMAHHPWPGDVLFLGQLVPATDLPWYYVPVWIAISTPLVFLAFFAVGTIRALRESCARGVPLATRADRLLLLTWFWAPILLAIALRSVLYDGWRQLHFVYPAFAMLATLGVGSAWRVARGPAPPWRRAVGAAALVALALDAAVTASWMVRWHPHQNVYFNAAAGSAERIAGSFDVDDRGLGCRRLLEQILKVDSKRRIAILSPGGVCWASTRLLPRAERGRLAAALTPGEADYVVLHHRRLVPLPSVPDERLAVRVDGLLVASARRVRGGSEEGERPFPGAGGRAAPVPGSP